MKIRIILLLIVCVSLLLACKPGGEGAHAMKVTKPWTIKLLVTGNGGNATMKVNTGPMTGCFKTQNGCMYFDKGEKGVVTFELSGNHDDFYITQLKFCMGATPPGDLDADCPLEEDNAKDFYVENSSGVKVNPDTSTGKIKWNYGDKIETFVLHDENNVKQEYYYMVIACNASNHCPKADPPLDNKG